MRDRHQRPPKPPKLRPQAPPHDERGLRFEALESDGKRTDGMPPAIRVTDAQGRTLVYVPIKLRGKVLQILLPGGHSPPRSRAASGFLASVRAGATRRE
jgi:hypothetical protein